MALHGSASSGSSGAPTTRNIATTAPLAGGGDLSADRTLSIAAATASVPGSMSPADKAKLDAITGTNTGDQTSVSGQAGSVANAVTFDNSGSGAASGATYNGSAAKTVSTNTIGALKASSNLSDVASVNTAARNLQGGYVLAQSAAAVSHTGDTVETTLATITIPAAAMGANGFVRIRTRLTVPNNANTKTLKVKFGGTVLVTQALTTTGGWFYDIEVANRALTNSQISTNIRMNTAGTAGRDDATAAIDTTASTDITITGQCGVGTDTITIESYQVILYPKA